MGLDQVTRLNRIGCQAVSRNEQWNGNFTKLEAYCASNGHCNVPKGYKADAALGLWVNTQRTAIKNGTLQPNRETCLNRIGFQADPTNETWNANFTKLEAYRASNGHCNVPRGHGDDPALGGWVMKQRAALKRNTLKLDQVTRLNRIGCQAVSRNEQWNENVTKLEAYRANNGHCNVPRGELSTNYKMSNNP